MPHPNEKSRMPTPSRATLSRKLRALEKMFARASSGRRVTFQVTTGAPRAPERTGVARCGVAAVEITPSVPVAMAGYSLAGTTAKGVRHPLFARALYIDDGVGHTAALCFVDLWCASRYLLHQAAAYTSTGAAGIGPSQLILAGTHTHAGPGNYFGNTLYDTIVSSDVLSGFQKKTADALAAVIAKCVNQAALSAVPARLGVASAPVWYVSRNRAHPAFLENKEAATWNVDGPGQGAPPDLPNVSHFAIDPRVFCLAAVSQATNTLLGAFATFSCHATALGEKNDEIDSDWPGVACNLAAQALASPSGGQPVVALADSAGADITPMQCDGNHGDDLVQRAGQAVGRGIVQAARQAVQDAGAFTVEIHYAELSPSLETPVVACLEEALQSPKSRHAWAIGAPAFGGATDGHSSLFPHVVQESMVSETFDHKDPQFPKSLGLPGVEAILQKLFRLEPADFVPIHTLKVAGHQFATYPGEPTITTAFRLERALKAATGAASASIIGYAGDYSGYYPTHEEYMLQRYEGASMIRGRHASQAISDALVDLATSRSIFNPPPRVKFSRFVSSEPRRTKD
jgi:neutral ceramidase